MAGWFSDDIDVPLRRGAPHAELFGPRADVTDADGVETSFDARREVLEHELGDALGVAGGLGLLALRLAVSHLNGALERAHHVAQANLGGFARERIATLRSALGAHDS